MASASPRIALTGLAMAPLLTGEPLPSCAEDLTPGNSFRTDPNASVPNSPVANGNWADEVELHESRRQAARRSAKSRGFLATARSHTSALVSVTSPSTGTAGADSPKKTSRTQEKPEWSWIPMQPIFPVPPRGGASLTSLKRTSASPPPRSGPSVVPLPAPIIGSPGGFYSSPFPSTHSESHLMFPLSPVSRLGSVCFEGNHFTPGYVSGGSDDKLDLEETPTPGSTKRGVGCATPDRASHPRDSLSSAEGPASQTSSAEAALVEIVVRLLRDPVLNPHQGSMSLDKLRHFSSKEAPEIYQAVVGAADTFQFWKALTCRHAEKLQMERRNGRLKRIYLTENLAWRENDEKMKTDMKLQEAYIVGCLKDMLERKPTLKLQEFIEGFSQLNHEAAGVPENYTTLPEGADLLRMLQRHNITVGSKRRLAVQSPQTTGILRA